MALIALMCKKVNLIKKKLFVSFDHGISPLGPLQLLPRHIILGHIRPGASRIILVY